MVVNGEQTDDHEDDDDNNDEVDRAIVMVYSSIGREVLMGTLAAFHMVILTHKDDNNMVVLYHYINTTNCTSGWMHGSHMRRT